jgi:hypothetical protein
VLISRRKVTKVRTEAIIKNQENIKEESKYLVNRPKRELRTNNDNTAREERTAKQMTGPVDGRYAPSERGWKAMEPKERESRTVEIGRYENIGREDSLEV